MELYSLLDEIQTIARNGLLYDSNAYDRERYTRLPSAERGPHTLAAIVHLCDVVVGQLTLSYEGRDLRDWPVEQAPHWRPDHARYAHAARGVWQSQ